MKPNPNPTTPERQILVVDDDEHTRNLLRDLCEASGFNVEMAEDGKTPVVAGVVQLGVEVLDGADEGVLA